MNYLVVNWTIFLLMFLALCYIYSDKFTNEKVYRRFNQWFESILPLYRDDLIHSSTVTTYV